MKKSYALYTCYAVFILISAYFFSFYINYVTYGDIKKLYVIFFADDTFYYTKTAENFVKYGFPTFDGINATNGFQILWMGILIGLAYLSEDGNLIYSAFIFCIIVHCLNSILIAALTKRLTGSLLWSFAAQIFYLANYLLFRANVMLMENTIGFTLVLLAFIRVYDGKLITRDRMSIGTAIVNAALMIALVLCRQDFAILVAVVGVLTFFIEGKRVSLGNLIVSAAPVGALLIVASVNQYYFGSPQLVSGYVKHEIFARPVYQSWDSFVFWMKLGFQYSQKQIYDVLIKPLVDFSRNQTQNASIGMVILLCVNLVWFLSRQILRGDRFQRLSRYVNGTKQSSNRSWLTLLVMVAVSAAHLILLNLYIPGSLYGAEWYYAIEMTSYFLVPIALLALVAHRLKLVGVGIFFVVFGVMLSQSTINQMTDQAKNWKPSPDNDRVVAYSTGEFIDKNYPPDAILSGFNAGATGYFSNRRLINLDGLINNYAYAHRVLLKDGQAQINSEELRLYLKEKNVSYFVDYAICMTCNDTEIGNLYKSIPFTVVDKFFTGNKWPVYRDELDPSKPHEIDPDHTKKQAIFIGRIEHHDNQ